MEKISLVILRLLLWKYPRYIIHSEITLSIILWILTALLLGTIFWNWFRNSSRKIFHLFLIFRKFFWEILGTSWVFFYNSYGSSFGNSFCIFYWIWSNNSDENSFFNSFSISVSYFGNFSWNASSNSFGKYFTISFWILSTLFLGNFFSNSFGFDFASTLVKNFRIFF